MAINNIPISLNNSSKKQLKTEAAEWARQAKKDSKKWNEMISKKYKSITSAST